MYKKLFFVAVLSVCLLSAGAVAGAEEKVVDDDAHIQNPGRMTPSTQTIYGGRQKATWSLTWSGTAPYRVYFRADSRYSYTVINQRTTVRGMNHTTEYFTTAPYARWTPDFFAEDSRGQLSAASAVVHQYLRQ